MPRRAVPEDPETKALRELEAEDEAVLTKQAMEAGPPPESRQLSERDEDDIWAIEDPRLADTDTFAQRLAVEGLTPEEAQQLPIVKTQTDPERKAEWLAALTQPTGNLEAANQLAKMARYYWRWSLLEDLDDPEEMTRKAESLDRRFQKKMTGEQQYEADVAAGPPPMPEMGGGY